ALVPKDVMRNTAFSAACVAILFVSATFFSVLFYVPQYLQKAGDLSAFQSGLGLLPFMAVFALTSFVAGPLYNRVGGRIIVTLGAAGIALGPFLISFGVESSGSLGGIIPGLVVLGIGVGLFYSSATTIGVTAVDESRSSLAGGIIYMFQVAGGSVGLALTTTLFASASGLISGLHVAFRFNAIAAAVGFLIVLFVVGPRVQPVKKQTSA
ncbi:MAG TPA: MFS transporter, partial [Solirubrobacterales bacterium]|nr:MFS transporter [Solirubrobacterales bacterium]